MNETPDKDQPAGGREHRRPIRIILPDEPPNLTPGAARALLRILVKAYERQQHAESDQQP